MRALAALLFLSACDAGHLGNPLLLPVHGVASAISNASYAQRRQVVKSALTAHEGDIRAALPTCAPRPATCPHLPDILETVPAAHHARVAAELRDAPSYNWSERATVIVMVHQP